MRYHGNEHGQDVRFVSRDPKKPESLHNTCRKPARARSLIPLRAVRRVAFGEKCIDQTASPLPRLLSPESAQWISSVRELLSLS